MLKKLNQQIKACKKCELYKGVTNKVIGRGSSNPKYLFIGEAPGEQEDKTATPFVGRSGKLLNEWIEYLKIKPEEYAVINSLKCRPPNNANPTREQLNACHEWLDKQIELLNPEYIFLIGNFAAREVGKIKEGITTISGKLFEKDGQKYIPIFHPSYILRGNRDWESTLGKVKEILYPQEQKEKVLDSSVVEPQKIIPQKYTPLHLHTIYSDTDSVMRIDRLVDFAVENGFSSLGIADHGTISGWWEFQNTCQGKSIHPILGIEFYVAPFFDDKTTKRYHLVAYAKNHAGIKNIFKLVDFSNRDGYYRKPRITMEKLYEHREGLVVTTACGLGVIALRINEGEMEEAKKVLSELQENFKDDLYIELQIHDFPEQRKVNPILIELAEEYNIKTIVTTDAHYLLPEDIKIHKALKAISYNQPLESAGFKIDTNYVMLDQDLIKHGLKINLPKQVMLESMKNSFEIEKKCIGILKPYDNALPKFEIEEDPFEGYETELIG